MKDKEGKDTKHTSFIVMMAAILAVILGVLNELLYPADVPSYDYLAKMIEFVAILVAAAALHCVLSHF